jgi:flavin-dependent dehydrogenase
MTHTAARPKISRPTLDNILRIGYEPVTKYMVRAGANVEVVIAGGGPAAAAAAVSLASSGIGVLMLVALRRTFRMAEAMPAGALQLLEALGMADLVRRIGVPVKGLENWWDAENPFTRQDPYVLVDRAEFATRMLEAAVLSGVAVEKVTQRPYLIPRGDCVVVEVAGRAREFEAAVDATGRAAIWSRPIKRAHKSIADVFEGLPLNKPAGLKLVRFNAGWAYRIGLRNYTTVALISPHRRSPQIPESVAGALGLSSRALRLIGRRLASVQWAVSPIQGRVITVGDAALAHDPISGQGIRFALASAMAAAAVIRTWRRSPPDRTTPSEFYADFIKTERMRHLRTIRFFHGTQFDDEDESAAEAGVVASSSHPQLSSRSPGKLYFSGRVEFAPLQVNGFIQPGEIIRLPDGDAVRWLGGFDLLRVRELTRPPATVSRLMQLLSFEGLDSDRAIAIVNWCVANRILGIVVSERS